VTTLALVVPSYGRPEDLRDCLAAAHAQSRPFDEIIVVVRDTDDATRTLLAVSTDVVVTVSVPGVLAAMRAGAARSASDLIGFTDDDARLPTGWAAQVVATMDEPASRDVGGLGGRDILFDGHAPRPTTLTTRVGTVSWWGRVTGNHHRGEGPARDVDVLKGVNAVYRREALGLPTSLRGDGAQAHFELSVGRYAREHHWRLRYDPSLTVHHHPAPRLGDDGRSTPSDTAVADSAYNAMRGLPPHQQTRRWLYVHVVGDAACPGVLRLLLALVARDRATLKRRRPSWRGTNDAWRQRHRPERFDRFTVPTP